MTKEVYMFTLYFLLCLKHLQKPQNGCQMVPPYCGTTTLMAACHPVVYPVPGNVSHPLANGQHYFPTGFVHQYNNAQV